MSETRQSAHANDAFSVEVNGIGTLGVSGVRGLETTVGRREIPLAEYLPRWLVGDRTVLRRDAVSPPLVLVRAATADDTLQGWFEAWVAGTASRRTVRVSLLDATGREAVGWECPNARPTRWVGPRLHADRPAVATETLELTHDGVERLTG